MILKRKECGFCTSWGHGKVQEHPYTSAARLVDGRLSYEGPSLFTLDPLLQETKPMAHNFKVGDHVEWNSEAGRARGTIKK
jgi:hypothetical protein